MLNSVINWCQDQQGRKGPSPVLATYCQKFPSLTDQQIEFLKTFDYPSKRSKATGDLLPREFCSGWGAQYLIVDGENVAPAGFEFLVEKIQSIKLLNDLSRVAVMSLSPGGYIIPHSDTPVEMQVSIPLILDSGFKFVWQDWGPEDLEKLSINLIDISRSHAVFNTGKVRIFINGTLGKTNSQVELRSMFNQPC